MPISLSPPPQPLRVPAPQLDMPVTSSPSSVSNPFMPSPLPIPSSTTQGIVTRSQRHIHYPKIQTDGTVSWSYPRAHLIAATVPLEPSSVTEALKFLEWRQAVDVEFHALMNT